MEHAMTYGQCRERGFAARQSGAGEDSIAIAGRLGGRSGHRTTISRCPCLKSPSSVAPTSANRVC